MGIDLTPEATDYIIENISQNVREINGALKSIHLHTTNNQRKKVDLIDVKRYIKNHVRAKTTIPYEKMIQIICDFYKVKPELLSTKLRKKEVVHTRQMTMYIFREHLNLSYSFIGKQFGNRDHTTVMHAYTKMQKTLEKDTATQKDFEVLKKRLDIV